MKKHLLTLSLLLGTGVLAMAQSPFIGVQNSPRKSMISSMMNPAEINNLDKKIEVNFLSINSSFNNNTITFGNILEFGGDVVDVAFQNAGSTVNMRTDLSILGPSFGIKSGKWAFGFSTQAFLKADIVDLDPTLGQSILDIAFESSNSITSISSNYNQRVNAAGWGEMGFLLGREIINTEKHKFSIGATAKLLFPGSYANFGLDRLSAVIVQDEFEVNLTEATGTLNLSYSEEDFDGGNFGLGTNGFTFGKVNGIGFDLGGNYQLKDAEGRSKLNLGLSIRNLGSMTFAEGQINNTYSMNIPEGEFFSLDQLSSNLDEVEQQLLASGYFTKTTETDGIKTNLPSIISGYAEVKFLKNLYVSAYGQVRTGDDFANETLTAQNLFVITPRLILGKFEVYSPWSKTDVSGYAGGLGLRFGGFFMGSNSILTGLTVDTKQADFHVGLSWGFGRYN